MTTRNILLTAHILFAIVTIGWLVTQAMLTPAAIRRGEAGAVRFGLTAAERLGPTGIIVFLLGIALVLRADNDGADFGSTWVSVSMLLFIAALVNGAVFIARAERAALEKLEAGQPAPDEAKRVSILGGVNMLLLTAIVWLMVDRPGAF